MDRWRMIHKGFLLASYPFFFSLCRCFRYNSIQFIQEKRLVKETWRSKAVMCVLGLQNAIQSVIARLENNEEEHK